MKYEIETPPRTIMEVYKMLPEGTLAELIDNTIYMSPSPVNKHQKILQSLFRKLSEQVEDNRKGELFIAPFDVYLDEQSNAVQPDIIIVLDENKGIVDTNGYIHGVPDILVEVLSPSNREYDLIKKRDLYERFGVKEYWIVDAETKLALVFELKARVFVKVGESLGVIQSTLLGQSFHF
jgi:Uma2 family endonuclease